MENAVSYSISEAADLLHLSSKTIRRYIKSGKLPSVKVPTKFGDEYRITAIPEAIKQEALDQAAEEAKVNIVPVDQPENKLDSQTLYQENIRLAAQLGAATERIRQLEDQLKMQQAQLKPAQERIQQLEGQLKLLEAPVSHPKTPWWKRLFGAK